MVFKPTLYTGCDATYAWKKIVITGRHASVKPVYIAAVYFTFIAEAFTIVLFVKDISKRVIIFCSSR